MVVFFLRNGGRKVEGGSTTPKSLERPEDKWIQAILPWRSWGHKARSHLGAETLEQKEDRTPRPFLSSKPPIPYSVIPLACLPWLCWARAWKGQRISQREVTSTITFHNYFPIYLSTSGGIERDKPTQSHSAPGTTTPERECNFKALWILPSWIA